MCTAATYKTKDFYFGRTLDYEFSYGEQVVITPRNYTFDFREKGKIPNHYAIIGMAHVAGDYPLYYDAVNEKGCGMAGLNFVKNACYHEKKNDKDKAEWSKGHKPKKHCKGNKAEKYRNVLLDSFSMFFKFLIGIFARENGLW